MWNAGSAPANASAFIDSAHPAIAQLPLTRMEQGAEGPRGQPQWRAMLSASLRQGAGGKRSFTLQRVSSAMAPLKHRAFDIAFALMRISGAARLAAPFTRGRGAILMLLHVRPFVARDFAPNRLLEVTPEFLDETLALVRSLGFGDHSLDAVPARLQQSEGRPFVAITLDDGYRDTLEHALPVFRGTPRPSRSSPCRDFSIAARRSGGSILKR